MPYRKNYRRKRPMTRSRRVYRRRSIYRARRALSNLHHFKRTVILSGISTATATTFGAKAFSLNELPDFSEFQNLYDQFRINKIVWKLVPNANNADAGATQRLPQIHSVLDYTDSTAPTSLDELVQYNNYRMTMGSRIHSRKLTPVFLDNVYVTSVTQRAGNPNFKKWLSTSNSTDVVHHGIKYAIGSTATAGAITYTPYVTFYISCKSVK